VAYPEKQGGLATASTAILSLAILSRAGCFFAPEFSVRTRREEIETLRKRERLDRFG
jgi:hypothetical protein